MAVNLETQQTVTQSKTMVQFSFGFTDGSFLQLNGRKTLKVQMKCFFLFPNLKEQQKSGRSPFTVS